VFALQCTSTVVVMARETGSWRWPALAFTSMMALAWTASFVTYRISSALLSGS
jgi:ferrous iron transport protein B